MFYVGKSLFLLNMPFLEVVHTQSEESKTWMIRMIG